MNVAELHKQVTSLQYEMSMVKGHGGQMLAPITDIDPLSVTLAADCATAINEILFALRRARIIQE